jgi:hypothetical protein
MSQSWFLGRKIISVEFTYDNVGIGFEDGSGLTIYNPCSVADTFQSSRYIGARIVAEYWSSDQFYVDLHNGNKIVVDLREAAWAGPEAMVFAYENNGYMVVSEPPGETTMFREEIRK